MKTAVRIGEARFDVEGGDGELNTLLTMYRLWLNALESSGRDAVKLEALTTRLRVQNDALAAAVAAFTPQEGVPDGTGPEPA